MKVLIESNTAQKLESSISNCFCLCGLNYHNFGVLKVDDKLQKSEAILHSAVNLDGFYYLTDSGVSLNVLSNPYQQEAGFRQGQFKIEYSQGKTTTSIHVHPDALKSKWPKSYWTLKHFTLSAYCSQQNYKLSRLQRKIFT